MPNFVLGAGKVYFDARVAGDLTGEKLIAETPSLSYSVKSTRASEKTSDGPIATPAFDVPTGIERSGAFACKDIADYNLALFTIADVSTVTTTAGAVTADPINGGKALVADRWYQLGLTAHPHAGVRAIEDLALKTGTTTYSAGSDYTADLDRGRIYVPAGSDMIGAIVAADYDTTAASWSQVASDDLGAPAAGALRFISDNTTGEGRDYYFPSVVLSPNGSLALKDRSKAQELSFEFSIQPPASGSAVYIDGLPG